MAFAAGCQCLPPPIDRPDGGDEDAGTDGGPVAMCRVADCPAPPQDAGVVCPFRAPDAGLSPSCIADTCVNECGDSRTCDVTDGGHCLRCGSSVKCSEGACMERRRCGFMVDNSTCINLLEDGTVWSVDQPASCRSVISNDGGVLGTWVDLDVGEALLNIPRLGGYCTAQDLFTGVPRMQVFCPFCTFLVVGCD